MDKEIIAAVDDLLRVLAEMRSRNWASAEEEEILSAEVAQAWTRIEDSIRETEYRAEARAEAKAIHLVKWYFASKNRPISPEDQVELDKIVAEDPPDWYED